MNNFLPPMCAREIGRKASQWEAARSTFRGNYTKFRDISDFFSSNSIQDPSVQTINTIYTRLDRFHDALAQRRDAAVELELTPLGRVRGKFIIESHEEQRLWKMTTMLFNWCGRYIWNPQVDPLNVLVLLSDLRFISEFVGILWMYVCTGINTTLEALIGEMDVRILRLME